MGENASMTLPETLELGALELGKKSRYDHYYDPQKLFPIPRQMKRAFFGFDVWNHYEVSWLNEKGKPIAAIATIIYGCDSENIIESKSMKLYFNSFNHTTFKNVEAVQSIVKKDLEERIKGSFLEVRLTPLHLFREETLHRGLKGICLDALDIECTRYHHHPAYLSAESLYVEETLYSDLLKSNCLVTNQPDWCSIQISYKGKKINHEGLLRYLISFRNDNEFHEQCIEKIFMQIIACCKPEELIVYGRSTRRGGIDINAYRSSKPIQVSDIPNIRLCRQ